MHKDRFSYGVSDFKTGEKKVVIMMIYAGREHVAYIKSKMICPERFKKSATDSDLLPYTSSKNHTPHSSPTPSPTPPQTPH